MRIGVAKLFSATVSDVEFSVKLMMPHVGLVYHGFRMLSSRPRSNGFRRSHGEFQTFISRPGSRSRRDLELAVTVIPRII
jgi:hypothetical protein